MEIKFTSICAFVRVVWLFHPSDEYTPLWFNVVNVFYVCRPTLMYDSRCLSVKSFAFVKVGLYMCL